MRSYAPEIHDYLFSGLTKIVEEVAAETGCAADLYITPGTPPVVNPPALVDKVSTILPLQLLDEPSMTAEDFSEYQQVVPGVFFFLGLGDVPSLHSDNFDFDDTILEKGADLFMQLAERFS